MKKMLFGIIFSMVVMSMKTVCGQTSVTIEAFTVVSTNASTNIIVTITPSNVTEDVVVGLRCLQGSGEAVFLPSGNTATNIRQSTTLTVKGKTLSNVASNMIMEAKLGTNILATKVFTVIDTDKIGFAQARSLAEQAITGIVQPEAGSPITVELTTGGAEYVVTFENIYEEGVLKGDFSAQVRIGASSGNVLGMERGP